jgi:5-methylcytosine-specific restriction endonuclease McrA
MSQVWCDECNKSYATRSSLVAHLKRYADSGRSCSDRAMEVDPPKTRTLVSITGSRYTKKSIPAPLKRDCWNQRIGAGTGVGLCFCCRVQELTPFDFEAGHIQAESCGGPTIIENLVPICGKCNRSMGSRNMMEFILKYYPSNDLLIR